MIMHYNTARGRFSAIADLIKVTRFVTKVMSSFHIKMRASKLDSTRRSTVLSIPFSHGSLPFLIQNKLLTKQKPKQRSLTEGEGSVQFTSLK